MIQDLLEISTRENLCQEGRGVETSPEIALWNLASKNNASKGNTRGGALWNVISVERVRDWLLLTHGNLSSPGITVPWNESTGRLNKLLQPPRMDTRFPSRRYKNERHVSCLMIKRRIEDWFEPISRWGEKYDFRIFLSNLFHWQIFNCRNIRFLHLKSKV